MLVLVGCAALSAYFYLRLSLPQTSGEIAVAGLDAPVEVLRDAHGIPHIFARSESDAQFALGFVHAQDRLWQLEMNRRTGAGRMAEVLGAAALDTDRPVDTIRDLLNLTVSKPSSLIEGLPDPLGQELVLFRDPRLTIIQVTIAPGRQYPPHNHRMEAAIGLYSGIERNLWYGSAGCTPPDQ